MYETMQEPLLNGPRDTGVESTGAGRTAPPAPEGTPNNAPLPNPWAPAGTTGAAPTANSTAATGTGNTTPAMPGANPFMGMMNNLGG